MATFTITTAVNIDSLASKSGGDIYNINGGYLTIDQDSRVGLNQTTSTSLGTMSLSATLGGTCEINSTLVRLIPYDSGTGNVPAWNTVISIAGASGLLIGVYSALNVASTATGVTMPVTGFLKIKQWNSVPYSIGTLTGIGANATDVDTSGWLEIVGDETGLCTVNRLNLFKIQGDYFYLGTTDGNRTTEYQIPSSGMLQYHAGVEVETATSSGVYEFYPCVGSITALSTNIATDEVRGKVCWISSGGLLRFGYDGVNSTGGYVPSIGRKVRIANIFLANCTNVLRTANALPNATLASRYEFTTTGGGVLDIDKASIGWYMNINQPYSITLNNVGILTTLVVTEAASVISWSNVNIGQEAANTQIGFILNLCFAGGVLTNCKFTRTAQAASGAYISSMTDISGFTFTNCGFVSFTKSANATTGSFTLTRGVNCNFNNVLLGGGRAFMTTCTDVLMSNTIYYDHPAITTTTSNAMNAFDVGTACVRCVFDGLSFGGLKLVQPYLGILNIGAAGCTDIKLRNLGTYISPLDMGGDYVDCTWTRTTTVMTITKVSHGLKTNDLIAMNIISDVTPKAVTTTSATLWTVASAPTSDTFTVTVTNAGTTSGSGSYYPVMTGTLVTLAGSAAAVNVKVQRCYTPHLRTGLTSMDNSSKNLTYESVFGTEWGVQLLPGLNTYMKMIQSTPALTAQTSCYGTHWLDYFTTAVSVNFSGVSWTRTTTVATVTSVGHGLRTGDLINVTTTSDASAIVKGQKTITAATSDTFRFTCLNAGSASGTLTFKQLNGRIAILMNESTSDTASLINLSGGAAFTSTGGLFMPIVNQYAIFETPYYLLGHLNFPIAVVVMGGGTIGNYDITYSLDFGSGYSSFKNLYYPRPGGGGSNGSTNVTMTSTVGVSVGDYVFGTNIAPNAKVVSITNSTTIVVDIANIGTVSGVLTFNQLPNESDITSSGVKMKVKILTSTTNSTAITSLFLYTYSDLVSRSYQYDLDVVNLTVTGLKDNTEVRIYLTGTTTEVGGIETATSGTTDNRYYTSSLTVGLVVDIAIINVTYENERITGYVIPSLDSSIPIQQRFDRNYNNTI